MKIRAIFFHGKGRGVTNFRRVTFPSFLFAKLHSFIYIVNYIFFITKNLFKVKKKRKKNRRSLIFLLSYKIYPKKKINIQTVIFFSKDVSLGEENRKWKMIPCQPPFSTSFEYFTYWGDLSPKYRQLCRESTVDYVFNQERGGRGEVAVA